MTIPCIPGCSSSNTTNTVSHHGFPWNIGFIQLIRALLTCIWNCTLQVKCTFRPYLSGEKVKQKKFTDDNYDSIMRQYWNTLQSLHESQWKQILDAVKLDDDCDHSHNENSSGIEIISAQQGQFYIPSSPVKGGKA